MSKSNDQEALSGLADGAQPLAGPHADMGRGSDSKSSYPLVALAGQRVAVELPIAGRKVTAVGRARYKPGKGLEIQLDDEALTEIWIDEATWNGTILRDPAQGGDFLIALVAAQASSSAAR